MKKIIDKLELFIKNNSTCILLFTVIFLLLFFQHQLIAMYFDDFGNASLSYNQTSSEITGTNYSFRDLWHWCVLTYNGWGGRILYAALILIPLLKFGTAIYMFLQSIVITLILFFSYKIANEISEKKSMLIPPILMILYMLINMEYLRHGIYWASASILYIWPLLPFLMFIYFYIKLTKKIENNKKINYYFWMPILLILNFFATFSQEQIGVAVLVFLIGFIIIKHMKNIKSFLILDLPNLIVNVVSFALLIFAPGNSARMDTNTEFSNLSIFGKIGKNLPEIFKNIFNSPMTIFMIILTIVFVLNIFINRKKLKVNKFVYFQFIFFSFISLVYFFIKDYNYYIPSIYGLLWILFVGIWLIIYGLKFNKIEIALLAVTGCSSIFCLILSPVVGGRTSLPFIFFIFLLIIIMLEDILSERYFKYILILLFVPLSFNGLVNYKINYNGYLENYGIEKLNFKILSSNYGIKDKKIINLYKYPETWFGSTRSYEEPSMDYWIKEYFNITQEAEFNWIDLYEEVR